MKKGPQSFYTEHPHFLQHHLPHGKCLVIHTECDFQILVYMNNTGINCRVSDTWLRIEASYTLEKSSRRPVDERT